MDTNAAIEGLKAQISTIEAAIAQYIADHSLCHVPTPPKTPPTAPLAVDTAVETHAPVSPPQPQIILATPFPPMIIKWAQAIKKWEGSFDPTNPGNMKYSALTASWGAMKGRAAKDGGNFASFRSAAAGFTALCHFLVLGCEDELQSYHNARTLDAFTTLYAGNPPLGYKEGIASMLGVPLSTDIATFL